MADHYRFHIRTFQEVFGTRPPTLEDAEEYRRYLTRQYGGVSTYAVKWAAFKNYFARHFTGEVEDRVKGLAWIEYCYPPPKRIKNQTERVSNAEFSKIYADASDREKCFMDLIRRMDLKISQLCNLRGDSMHVPEDLRHRCAEIFNGDTWLCETANGKQYSRNYISNQIAYRAKRTIGRAVRAEALRPQVKLAGGVALDLNGRTA